MKTEVLSQLLSKHMEMHPARRLLLCGIIFGMLKTGRSTQKRLADGLSGSGKMDSKIRKIQAFFKEQAINFISAGRLILELLEPVFMI